jgi:acyl transferase domain-containing protein/acyl carrier protein
MMENAMSAIDRPMIVFVYSGIGSRWPGMAADMLRSDPVFLARFLEVDRALADRAGISARDLAESAAPLPPGAEHVLNFAYQSAMTARLRDWGMRPDYYAGHSAGEVAAAVESGALTLDEGATLAGVQAGVLDGWGERCGLAFVAMPPSEALAAAGDAGGEVVAAAINDPFSTVFAGPPEGLDALVGKVAAAGVFARRLSLFSPLHHPLLAPRLDAMRRALAGLRPGLPAAPFLSSWRGGLALPGDFDAEYWVSHVRQINRFGEAMLSLPKERSYVAVEIAPHPLLGNSLRACFGAAGVTGAAAATGKKNEAPGESLRKMLWEVRRNGLNLDWNALAPVMGAAPDTCPAGGDSVIARWPEGERRGRLVEAIVAMVGELAGGGAPDPGADSGFLESGLDSLGLIGLQTELRGRYGIEVGAEMFFRCPTPRELANKILGLDEPGGLPPPAGAATGDGGVAVVGMACRLPGGADSPDAYWRLLMAGGDAIVPVPAERWDKDAWYDPDPRKPGKTHTRAGGFLKEAVDGFDADFFGVSAAEADALDPQQRLFLETAWEAIESAGIDPTSLKGRRVGVFLGLSADDYAVVHRYRDPRRLGGYSLTGSTGSTACGRVSFFLGLEGPSYVVDTACSSSLACMHLARRALLDGEVDMALAGGANVMLIPEIHVCFSKLGATSEDGRCKTFAAGASGYGRGEGAGMVLLKRLGDARRDRDPVLAVVRGSAVNSDGRSSSLTAPNGKAQEAVARQALAQAGWRPEEVGYIETHGTGTPLGDAVEAAALGDVYGVVRRAGAPSLRIGSVKPVIGHLEAAAGVASFIKAALAVKNGVIPASPGCDTPNPRIDWDRLRVAVNRQASPWPGDRRRAGISAFGIGGTNCHVLMEDAEGDGGGRAEAEDGTDLILLSARTSEALRELCGRWAGALRRRDAPPFADACHTSRAGRARFRRRVAAAGKDGPALAESLSRLAASDAVGRDPVPAVPPGVVFLYPGQGAQRVGMGRGLYESQPVYRAAFDRAAKAFSPALPTPLGEAIFGVGADAARLSGHLYAQASMFAAGVAATELWRSWGIRPSAVAGHSVGEYAAAWAAGALRLEAAARLVAERAMAMDRLPPGGGMSAAALTAEETLASIASGGFAGLEVAAANAPGSTVVSGPLAALRRWGESLEAAGVRVTPLAVSGAFHSAAVEPVLDKLLRVGGETSYSAPAIEWWSTRRAEPMRGGDFSGYWAEQTRGGVRFMDAVRAIRNAGGTIFVEMGPGATLCGLGRASCPDALFLPGMGAAGLERETALRSLGSLWERGLNPDPAGLNPNDRARRISMPTYAFQRRRHWDAAARVFPAAGAAASAAAVPPEQPYLGSVLDGPGVEGSVWESIYSDSFPDFMPEHVILGRAIAPAAAYISLAISAGIERWGLARPLELSDFEFSEALIGDAGHPRRVRVVLGPEGGFAVASREADEAGGEWIRHATGGIRPLDSAPPIKAPPPPLSGAGVIEENRDDVYGVFLGNDYALGESFRHIRSARIVADIADCAVDCVPPERLRGLPLVHPGIMDSLIQTGMPAMGAKRGAYLAGKRILVPMRLDRMVVWKLPDAETRCLCYLRHAEGATVNNLEVFDAAGRQIMDIEGLILRRSSRESLYRDVRRRPGLFVIGHVPATPPEGSEVDGWIVAGDARAEAEAFASALRAAGAKNLIMGDAAAGRAALAGQLAANRVDGRNWRFVFAAGGGGDDADSALRIVGGVYNFAQALADTGALDRGRLWLVARNGDESPWSGALSGFGRSFRQEQQDAWGGFARVASWNAPGLPALLSAAMPLGDDEWIIDASGAAEVPRLAPLAPAGRREAAENAKRASGRIRGGTHWLTGGAGALGRELAAWLLARGAARVILSGRRPAGAEVAAALEGLRGLAGDGAAVEYRRCDVKDAGAVRRLVESLADGPPLKGIYHAAGVLADGVLTGKAWDSVWNALETKAVGALNLDAATRGLPLENFILFSSASSLLGSAGQTAYSSANAALDSIARRRRTAGLPALSVQWGPWAGGGMAAVSGGGGRLSRFGMAGMNPADALYGLEQVMGRDLGVVSIMHMDWGDYFEQWPGGDAPGRFEPVRPREKSPDAERDGLAERLAAVSSGERRAAIEAWLDEAARRLLGRHERLDPEAPLFEQGFDSLMAIEWRNCLAKALGGSIPSSFLFDFPTLSLVADHLLGEMFGREGAGASEARAPAADAAAGARELLDELDGLLGENS